MATLTTSWKLKLSTILYVISSFYQRTFPTFLNKLIFLILDHHISLELNVKYVPSAGVLLSNPTLYRTLVGNLAYLSITRLDISYTMYIVSNNNGSKNFRSWGQYSYIVINTKMYHIFFFFFKIFQGRSMISTF